MPIRYVIVTRAMTRSLPVTVNGSIRFKMRMGGTQDRKHFRARVGQRATDTLVRASAISRRLTIDGP